MSLDDVVTINITTQTRTPTQRGFGTPLVMAYHALDAVTRVRTYTKLADMATDGFSLLSGAYLAAVAIKSQNPSPPRWKIGRRAAAALQQVKFTALTAVAGDVASFTLREPSGVGTTHEISYTVQSGDDTADVAAGLAEALLGLTGPSGLTGPTGPTGPSGCGHTGPYGVVANVIGPVGGTGPTSSQFMVSTSGKGATVTGGLLADFRTPSKGLGLENVTLDSGIAADILACAEEDSDFYGIVLDSNGAAEVLAAAAQVETMIAILAVDTADTGCTSAQSTTDVGQQLADLAYARTIPCFNSKRVLSWLGASAMGGRLPDTPGSSTWCHKHYPGVILDVISGTAETQLKARHMNYYIELGGSGDFMWGTTAAGEYVDITIFCDWLRARMQERCVGKLQSVKKIPFTDNGINIMVSEVKAQLGDGVKSGGLAEDPAPTVTAPAAKDVSTANKVGRFLPDIEFGGNLAGAIHALQISGTIGV
jgi:hypothetical protein